MHAEELRRVVSFFKENPDQFEMHDFAEPKDGYESVDESGPDFPVCKSTLCVAGCCVLLAGKAKLVWRKVWGKYDLDFVDPVTGIHFPVWDEAQKIFGLTDKQALTLFIGPYWPDAFRLDINQGPAYNTNQLEKRVEHLIETGR